MKKIIALVLCTISICALLCSCNYQDAVDSVRTELMNTSKDLLDPFFKESQESTAEGEEAVHQANQRRHTLGVAGTAAGKLAGSNHVVFNFKVNRAAANAVGLICSHSFLLK